jgi:hypothetical protein
LIEGEGLYNEDGGDFWPTCEQSKLFQADLSTSIILRAHQVRMAQRLRKAVEVGGRIQRLSASPDFTFPGGSRARPPDCNSTKGSDFVILAFSFDGL